MRTIKFRAWDSEAETMFYSDQRCVDAWFTFNETSEFVVVIQHGETAAGIHSPPEPIYEELDNIMQFTGLKDKNGKEIYEGDIVYVPEGYGGDLLYKEFIGIVDYDPPEFYINQQESIKKTRKWHGQEYGWDELEIIGNIYENPELIK